MTRKLLHVVGYALCGLFVLGLFLRMVMALRAGEMFMGQSYKFLPIGTYYVLAIFVVAGCVGVVWVVQKVLRALRERRATSGDGPSGGEVDRRIR